MGLSTVVLVPAVAQAERFEGSTSQATKSISLRTNAAEEVTTASIEWKAPCQYGGGLADVTSFFQPFDRSGPSGFKDGGFETLGIDGSPDLKARLRSVIEGEPRGGRRYVGTFRMVIKITRDGDYFSTCRSGRVRWTAAAR